MNDDELSERLARTLHAKAGQVRVDDEPIDPTISVATLDEARATRKDRGWAIAVAAAAAAAVLLGVVSVAGIALRNRSDTTPAAPLPRVTTSTQRVLPDPTPRALAGWADVPDAFADGSVPVDRF